MLFVRNTLWLAMACAALFLTPLTSCAQETPKNQAESSSSLVDLQVRLDEFVILLDGDNIAATLDFIPPQLLKQLLKDSGVTEQQFRAAVNQSWATTLETITVEQVSFDANNIVFDTSSIGRSYALIPLNMSMGLKSDPTSIVVSSSTTLALVDASTWYIVRLDEPKTVDIFNKAYPDMANITIPSATMEMVKRKDNP